MDFQVLGLEEEGTASHRPFIYSAWQFFSQRWKGSKIYLTEPTLISGLPSWGLWFLYLSSKEENSLRFLLVKRSAKDVGLSINFSWILPLASLPSSKEMNIFYSFLWIIWILLRDFVFYLFWRTTFWGSTDKKKRPTHRRSWEQESWL